MAAKPVSHSLLLRIAITFVVIALIYTFYAFLHKEKEEKTSISESDQEVAIVVLGGGLTSTGEVPAHTQLRIDRAIHLYTHEYQRRAVVITLSGGTPHKPNPLDSDGFPIWEATAAAKRLIELGIPPTHVFEESFSLDTIGNAYFLRAIHVLPSRLSKLVVITNDWHMPRTRAIFERVFSLPLHRPTHQKLTSSAYNKANDMSQRIELIFDSVASGIADPDILSARKRKEKESLDSFVAHVLPRWSSFAQLREWLFTEHSAYASNRLLPSSNKSKAKIDPDVLKSY